MLMSGPRLPGRPGPRIHHWEYAGSCKSSPPRSGDGSIAQGGRARRHLLGRQDTSVLHPAQLGLKGDIPGILELRWCLSCGLVFHASVP